MNREPTSFDPKTWLDQKPAARETTSFDPKTWVGDETSSADPPLDPPDPVNAPAARSSVPLPAIAGIAVAIVCGIGAWIWFDSPNEPGGADKATAPVAAAAPVPVPTPAEARQILRVRNLQNLGLALSELGVPLADAMVVARETVGALGVEDEEMRIEVVLRGSGDQRVVHSIIAELDGGTGVQLTRKVDGGYAREENFLNASTKIRTAEGSIRHATFYASALEAGVPDSLITPFAKAFSFDFDFREVKQGDTFLAVWEERVTASGRRLSPPQLIYAEMDTAAFGARAYYAFVPPDEVEPRWFDAKGNGAARGLMRTPVDGARITSGFGMRFHPIRKTARPHNGTDFAAPTGTPIYASGNATVAAVAPLAGAAGNMIKLQHDDHMQTWYMHMVRFADGIAAGQQITQGEVIGYVGTTGGSTGPHLHYEIRIDGVPTDPLTYETAKVEPLVGEATTMFAARRAEIDAARK